MNVSYEKYRKAKESHKIPKKLKKYILGTKINKSKLKRMIKSSKVVSDDGYNFYIDPFGFCPICGCTITETHDHGVDYPEIWIDDYCFRCGEFVGGADNSRYHHVLEDLIN